MSKRLALSASVLAALAIAAGVFFLVRPRKAVHEVRFDLGKNIMETARRSGVPSFDVTNDFGLIEYGVVELPKNVVVMFARPGLEVGWPAVFSFTIVANHNRSPDDIADQASLQLSNSALRNTEEARRFVDSTLAQFARSNWQRFIPEWCPRVTGRSSVLDESGAVDRIAACPIDPSYRIPAESFAAFFDTTRYWIWHSGDVYARFKLNRMTISGEDVYTAFLEFENEDDVRAVAQNDVPRDRRSPAERLIDAQKERRAIQALEAAAIRRGDKVLEH
jgi:hypothetical protein